MEPISPPLAERSRTGISKGRPIAVYLGTIVTLAAGYFAVAKIGLALAQVHPSATAVWPPAGCALAGLLLLGRRVWPAIFAGAFLANLTTAGSAATSLGIAAGNALEALLGAQLILRWAGGRTVMSRPQSIVKLAIVAGIGAALSATVGVVSLAAGGFAPWAQFGVIWRTWWMGNVSGVLLVTPLALAWSLEPAFRWERARLWEAAALLLSLVIVAQWVFGGWRLLPASDQRLTFLCIPFILWAGWRFHQQGAASAVFLVGALGVVGALEGRGPFTPALPDEALLMNQLFSVVMSITSLVLAASVSERQRLENALRGASEDLGLRFQRQQADLAKAIEALRAAIAARGIAERYARLVIETTERPIVVLDPQLRVRMANPAFCRTFRLAERKVEDHPLHELGNREWDRPELRALLEDVASKGIRHEGTDIELDVPGLGSRRFLIDARCLVPDKTKMEMVIFLSMEDVTQRKAAEEALRASEARFRAVADTAIDGIICANDRGEIVYANPAVGRIFGHHADELGGRPLALLMPERFHDPRRRDFRRHLATGRAGTLRKTVELVGLRKDGTEFPLELSLTSWEAGAQIMFAGIMRDISQRKTAEAEILRLNAELEERVRLRTQDLEHSNRELERFAFLAAHDLQEPLRTVTGYAQLLSRRHRGRLDPRADEMIDMVTSGASWMHELIKDLLEYSRLGRVALRLGPVDCESVVQRALANLEVAIRESRARVTHDPLPRVVADEPQLVLVFQNLIANALKFRGPALPRVHIGARRVEGDWKISIHDNGIGIDPQHLERIFGVFQRLHTREEYPGTGIGLAICRRVVERLGGALWAESRPATGSTFHLKLAGAAQPALQPVESGTGAG